MIQENDLQWMVRDSSNVIRGPYAHGEVLQLIKKGQIRGKTEISRANSYWFALEEKAELARFFPELGIKAPEPSAEMTATLNQADHGIEHTQFTPSPTRKDLGEPAKEPASGGAQWLNEDLANEFGLDDGLTDISIQTATNIPEAPDQNSANYREFDREKTKLTPDQIATQEMLKRTAARDDTLPSEQKNFVGDRPRPIDAVIRAPEKSASAVTTSTLVKVPVEDHERHANILEEEPAGGRSRGKSLLMVGAVIALVGGALFAGSRMLSSESRGVGKRFERASAASTELAMKKSLLLFDLEGAKEALSELELDPNAKGKVTLPIAQALVKKEFMYDPDGAITSLQSAESFAGDKETRAEVENLISAYRFERDKEAALDGFRRVSAAFPAEAVFRYNLSLAQVRAGHVAEGLSVATGMSGTLTRGEPLTEDAAVLLGWGRHLASKGADPGIEAAYLRALDANPNSAKARLGLALYRFRKGGLRESEADFRAFLEALPELDPPTRIFNFRKMSDFEFYNFARSQIRDLNIPLGAAGTRPSPLVMAVDAILSCLQSRTGEAGKILELALSAAPGDQNLLKAVGYHRWKEGRHQEIIDLLKDVPLDRHSFAISLLMGKAYAKIGRRDMAEKYYENLTISNPMRSEGWSLLGDVQIRQGRTELARKNLENALSRDPLDIIALRGLDRLGAAGVITPDLTKNLPF